MRRGVALAALALASCTPKPVLLEAPRLPDAVALGGATWLIPGGFEPGRSPDGNSVILAGPEGAILVDTGRHLGHVEAIERGFRALGFPLAAIVNTHWHLDHVSGNPTLRALHPGVKVYGTSAIDGALTRFLATSADASRKALADGSVPESAIPDVKGDLATIARGGELRADVVVDEPRDLSIAGRPLSLRIARRAATERDLWIYDAAEKRAIVGDLVTLPAPFFDTACPEGWLKALDDIASSGARQVVPGHGPLMTIAEFNGWHRAFTDFMACTRGSGALEACSAGWLAGAKSWIGDDTARAKAMADYYGGLIRGGKLDGYCKA